MNLQKKPDYEVFELVEMKSKDRGSVNIKAGALISDGADSYEIPYSGHFPIIPHPDLTDKMDELKKYLLMFFGYDTLFSLVPKDKQGAVDELKRSTRVIGCRIYGKDKKKLVIFGSIFGADVKTGSMDLENEKWGADLYELFQKIEREIYSYIFENKKAQLELFD